MFLDYTQRRSTVSRTPLDEWSARRRDLYLTTHDTHNRQISMPPVGFEPKTSAGERPAAARLLRSWVRIPPVTWIFVCCECRVLSGRGLCDELITRPEESYRLCCVVVWPRNIKNRCSIYIYIYDISSPRVNSLILFWRRPEAKLGTYFCPVDYEGPVFCDSCWPCFMFILQSIAVLNHWLCPVKASCWTC